MPRVKSAAGALIASMPRARFLLLLIAVGFLVRVPLILWPAEPIFDHRIYYETAKRHRSRARIRRLYRLPAGPSVLARAVELAIRRQFAGHGGGTSALVAGDHPPEFLRIQAVRRKRGPMGGSRCGAVSCPGRLLRFARPRDHRYFLVAVLALLLIRDAPLWWVACGLCAGVLTLVRPTYVFAPVIAGAVLSLTRRDWTRALAAGAVIAAAMLAVIAPWTYRNYKMFGEFCLVSANSGWVLLSSNHPDSDGIWMETAQIGANLNRVAQDRLQRRMAIQAIEDKPWLFAQRTVKRVIYMWGGETSIPDFSLGGAGWYRSTLREALRAITQFAWAWLIVSVCLGFLGPPAAQRRSERLAGVLWLVGLCFLLLAIHAVMEPAARHHAVVLTTIAALGLPAYSASIRAGWPRAWRQRTQVASFEWCDPPAQTEPDRTASLPDERSPKRG